MMNNENEPINEIVLSDEPLDGKKAATEQDIYLLALAVAGLYLLETTKDRLREFDEAHLEFAEFTHAPSNFDKAIDERIKFFQRRIKDFCDTKASNAISRYIVADKIAKRMEEIEGKENKK